MTEESIDWTRDRVGAALRGESPSVLRRLSAGFACIGDVQFIPGYSVLISDTPGIDRLTDLPRERRLAFLDDMDRLGEAVQVVCSRRDPAFRRVNYEILGNTDAFLHAHVWPRYDWEGDIAPKPVWMHPGERWSDPAPDTVLGTQHDDLRRELTAELDRLTGASAAH